MGFSVSAGVPAATVFLQGILSFFSPCVLPLVPLYMSYLAGGAQTVGEDGVIRYPRGRIMTHTVCFVLGVSSAFFLLGLGFSALGLFFSEHKLWFVRISGVIMILFGLYQLGVFGRAAALDSDRRLPFNLSRFAMNPLIALALGFTFSFAWTPCVGPALGSVLLMASSAQTAAAGFLLIGVYTLGFILPFLAVGLFTGAVLGFFKKHQAVVKYTVKAGGVLLILMGIMTLTGFMNGFTSYLSAASGGAGQQTQEQSDALPAPDFTLTDQYGNEHTLSDYHGKTVFLNFWATWCGPCQSEMPDIQALYEKYGENEDDLVVLGVANPKSAEYPNANDVSEEEVIAFLNDHGYDFPVVMDLSGSVFAEYGISAFPTTFMIDSDGNVFGYASGALTPDMMESIVQQTMSGKRAE